MKNKKPYSFRNLFIIISIIFFIIFFNTVIKKGLIKPDKDYQRIGMVNNEPVYSWEYKLYLDHFYRKASYHKKETLNKDDSAIVKDTSWKILIKESILDQQVVQSGIKISDEENRKNNFADFETGYIIDYFMDVFYPLENDLNTLGKRRIRYVKLFREVTKQKSGNKEKKAEFDRWFNELNNNAEIHDLRDRFFRE